ncbi:MAG: iron-containing alcohol dehydrogenase [Lachnospiraceae bacterium]|nr:iron-containing alcohol dehydrogenase [Lachnospiraceae bacterium]
MQNFESYNPTRIIFGKDTHVQVGMETAKYAKKVLLHYGGKSLKANGTYDVVVDSLQRAGIPFVELGGVKSNPRLSLVEEGIQLCREEQVDFILAVGGGSVIDSAKTIAVGACYDGDVWDFFSKGKMPEQTLPVGVVLTIPAAGSESSNGAVITREDTQEKRSFCSDIAYPVFAILNPALCYTLPKHQIAAGGADIMAHIMERYFSTEPHTDLSDHLCEATMCTLVQELPKVLVDVQDYDAWAEVMWTGNVAHNGLLGKGRIEDWASHGIEHEISAIYDIAHGAGLAIVFPAWMRYVSHICPSRFVQFAVRVFHVDLPMADTEAIVQEGIHRLESFFRSLGLETRLSEINIGREHFEAMGEKACNGGTLGGFQKLSPADVVKILELAL